MTEPTFDQPVPLAEAVRVLNELSKAKTLELNQRMLDDPSLRSSVGELSMAAIGQIPQFTSTIMVANESLGPAFPHLDASLRSRVVELSALVSGLSYPAAEQIDRLRAINSEVLAVMKYLNGLFDTRNSEENVMRPIRDMRALSKDYEQIARDLADVELEENRRRSADAAREAELAAEASKRAAGTSADTTLGSYYERIATEEASDAKNFRRAAIAFLVVGVAIAGWIAYVIVSDHEEGIASQLFKVAACLPVLGVAFYLSHESNTHRMVARRAREVEVRLYTLEAFLAPLEPEQRAELRAKVGESILVGPLALSPGTEKQALDAQEIIEKLIDKAGS